MAFCVVRGKSRIRNRKYKISQGNNMRKRKDRKKEILAAAALAAMLLSSGCSRSVLNYQIAECIGTLNQYENNEPVETPKMKAERELKESESEREVQRQKALDEAAALALEYRYDEAIAYLQNSDALADDERLDEAVAQYEEAKSQIYRYEGDIPHFCFTNLVVDPSRAFDGDNYDSTYRNNMITLTEFQNILQTLYDNNYILIDLHDLANETADGKNITMTQNNPEVPKGKKPMVLSIDNLSYASVRNGDGVATALAIDENGMVAAKYTDENGHDLVGAYDVVPVLESFLEEHPDFSYQGARGVISVAGVGGIFGYGVDESADNYEANRKTVQEIAAALKVEGWTFASTGYNYQYLRTLSYNQLDSELSKWQEMSGALLGDCDTLLYPYGSEVDYTTEKGTLLWVDGFRYLIGLWAEGDHLEVNDQYLRQTRKNITGMLLTTSPDCVSSYINVSDILDPARN